VAGTPDVRVRLSAEGVAEVVQALKKIQAEGTQTGRRGQQSFRGFNNILGSTRNLLAGLGVALGAHQFISFIRNSTDAADALAKTSKRIGANVENLSALSYVARLADSSLEQVGTGMARMLRAIGDARAGIPTAVAMFRDLDIEVNDFEGKDAVEIFELLAMKIHEVGDVALKRRVAMQIFGRAGANLIPTMDALAKEGLAKVIERGKELGVIMDEDLTRSAEVLKDEIETLRIQGEVVGASFMTGFGPEASKTLQAVTGDVGQAQEAWEDFGYGVGLVLKWIVGAVATAFDFVGTNLGALVTTAVSYSKRLGMRVRGDFEGIRQEAETFNRWWNREDERLSRRISGRFAGPSQLEQRLAAPKSLGGAVDPRARVTDETRSPGEPDPERLAELADREARAMQAALDRELALAKAFASLKNEAEQRAFEEGLQDVEEYYRDRRQIIDDAYAEQQRVLNEKRALLADIIDPGQRKKEEEKIDQEARKARLEYENDVAELLFEERETVRDLAGERLSLEQDLLKMQGQRIEAERLGFEERIRQARLLLQQQGEMSPEQIDAFLSSFRARLEAGATFDEAKRDAERALTQYEAERSDIEARAAAGLISQFQAEAEILGLEKERLATLRALADSMVAAAEATGDPEKIAQAERFAAQVREIGYAVQASESAFAGLGDEVLSSARGALTEFFDTGMQGADNLGDAFRNMAASIVASLRRISSEFLANQLFDWVSGFFSGGGEVGTGKLKAPVKRAGGGPIVGPGTATSDSILVAASNGEYIVNAASVNQPGVRELLQDINARGSRALLTRVEPISVHGVDAPGYASGGLVQASPMTGGGVSDVSGRLLVALEDGLVAKVLESREGQRIQVQNVKKNARAFRAALGLGG